MTYTLTRLGIQPSDPEYRRAEQMAVRVAGRWYHKHFRRIPQSLGLEDFEQTARIWVWESSRAYVPERGLRFTTFALRLLEHRLLRLALLQRQACTREDWLLGSDNSLVRSLDYEVEEGISIVDVLPDGRFDTEREALGSQFAKEVRRLLATYPYRRQREVFELCTFGGLAAGAVERQLHLPKNTAARWSRRVARWLRGRLGTEE